MTDYPTFILRFPEFDSIGEIRIDMFIEEATLIMQEDDGRWLSFYDIAHAYLVAHLLAISDIQAKGEIGVVAPISKQVVDVTVESAVSEIPYEAAMFGATSYGSHYLMYRRMCFAGIYGV